MDERDWKTLEALAKSQGTELPGGGIAVAKKRKCGKCGGSGHNARTCSEDEAPVVERPTRAPRPERQTKVVEAPPVVIKQVERPTLKLSPEERKHRVREGKEIVEAKRLVYYARIERWLKDKHKILARRCTSVDDLKKGTQLVFVEMVRDHWGVEPTKHYRGKVDSFDKKTKSVKFKCQRDTAIYSTNTDYILNLTVPGGSRYYLVYNGKTE